MRPFVRWLLDLETIPADAQGVELVFERPFAPWVWALLVLGAAGLSAWAYTRIVGSPRGRAVLAVARGAAVMLLLLLIASPALRLSRETREPDWVLMLVDRSASLSIPDAPGPQGAPRRTRDDQLRAILSENARTWEDLSSGRRVEWLGFHDGAFGLAAGAEPGAPVVLEEPGGLQTRLDAALSQALRRTAVRSLSGVVVFSDGRTTDPPSRATVRRLRSDQVGVYVVPLGSAESPGDLALRRVEAPRRAFVRDQVPVVVEVDRLAGSRELQGAVVKLVDEVTGEELDREELPPGGESARVTLVAEPMLAGEATWRVVVEPPQPDLVAENNERNVLVELVDRPLRVLYVEGYPRWEYRYLKNLLIREQSIETSVMLISADRDFAQEGNQPITRLPRSPEELAPYDVIVLGDVPGSFFSPEQLEMIRQHVAQRGAGLLWIGGERFTPRTHMGTALADLLPIRGTQALPAFGEPVNLVPTALAERLGLLRLEDDSASWPAELADPSAGWSALQWAQRIEPGRLKPTAEVLAETAQEHRGARLPLIVHMRYGAGRTIYVATDEIWRWRYGRGERLPERFWVQIIRRLGRESLLGGGDAVRLEVTPRRVTTGQAVRVELRLLDARLSEAARAGVAATIRTADGAPVGELELRRVESPAGAIQGAEPAEFAATWIPGVAGNLVLRVDEPALEGIRPQVGLEVFTPDDELRRPETDHGLLAALAEETGGRVLGPQDLSGLPALLPNRSVRTVSPLTETIWDTPLALAAVLLVLTGEWIGRKLVRLA
jgi:hypothetical protein